VTLRLLPPVAALASLSCTGPVAALIPVKRADVADVVYTPAARPAAMAGDIYRPKSAGPHPAVLMIHGDGRIGDDGRWQMAGIARQLAASGYCVFNITYRMAPEWTYPAPLEDVLAALDWMENNAAEQGIDPERIAVFGYSAGGYAGSLAALTDGRNRVKAVVAGGAPSDLTYYSEGRLIRNFLGGRLEEVPELFHEASPVNHVTPSSPPFFLYHGEDDTLVHPDHLREMEVELKAHGVPHEIHWIRGKGHIRTFLFPDGAIEASIRFLDRHMKGQISG
jgi:acetyl esterase/lipase